VLIAAVSAGHRVASVHGPAIVIAGVCRLCRHTVRAGLSVLHLIDPKGSFLKNLILSLVLLGVSSLLFPTVLKQIDDRKAIDQQRFQEQLSRQDQILDAQAALLDTMASDFWQYELYASDVVISRDERFGQDDWHRRAVDAYYLQTGPLLGKMRGEISTLLRLAPPANYEVFLRLYEDEVLPLDSCLLELMKIEAASSGTRRGPVNLLPRRNRSLPAAWPARGSSPGHPGTRWRPVSCTRIWPIASIGSLPAWLGRFNSKGRLTSVPVNWAHGAGPGEDA
jgi:hypothetical protein